MNDNGETLQTIFRDPAEIDWLRVAVAVALTAALVPGVRYLLGRLVTVLPERLAVYLLPWAPILRLAILAAAAVYVTPLVVYPTPQNLFAVGGALAVAIGFAFKDYVSSLLAGVVVLVERPYRVSDWVRIGDAYGVVRSLGMRAVEIVTPDDTRVVIPHGAIWTSPIHNDNSGARELQCVADFYLDPVHDGAAVREALRDVALTCAYLHPEHDVAVTAAERPWGTHYRLKAYPVAARDQFRFVTDLTVRGKAALARLGALPARPPAVAAE